MSDASQTISIDGSRKLRSSVAMSLVLAAASGLPAFAQVSPNQASADPVPSEAPSADEPQPLAYLDGTDNRAAGSLSIELDVWIESQQMRETATCLHRFLHANPQRRSTVIRMSAQSAHDGAVAASSRTTVASVGRGALSTTQGEFSTEVVTVRAGVGGPQEDPGIILR